MPARFPQKTLDAIDATKYLYLRAGDAHRFIAVWVVVVNDRVLVRSWNDRPDGWYRAFRRQRIGAIRLGSREVPVRAAPVKSSPLAAAATMAYGRKYTTKANRPYVEGFATPARMATTLELVPGAR